MPTIQSFRGLRYNLGQVGNLSDVITPPYDVISPEFQDELYKKHPANFIRLELNRDEPGDNEQSNKYTRAARFLKNWRSEGLGPEPTTYSARTVRYHLSDVQVWLLAVKEAGGVRAVRRERVQVGA